MLQAMDREKWKSMIKVPMRCEHCVMRDQDRAQVRSVISDIIDQIDPPPPAAKVTVASKNPKATWSNREIWFFDKTTAGHVYGTSRYGRAMKRPLEYKGPGRKCPHCLQYWPIGMNRRLDNEPLKEGECAGCGQQMPEFQTSKKMKLNK